MSDEDTAPVVTEAPPKALDQEGVVHSDRATAGKVFKLTPVPHWPNCKVSVRRVSDARKNQIYDEEKVNFVGGKPQNSRLAKATAQIQRESFESMEGWRDGDAPKGADGKHPLLPSSPENFVRICKHRVEIDGERTTVWLQIEEQIDNELAGAEGNS